MITVTIQMKPYLAAYLQSAYAHCTVEGAIRFTKNQNLYSCLLQLTTPRPKGVSWRDRGNVTLSLPCPSVGKDPRTYNYLGEEAVKILEQEINYEMRMDYYRFLRRNKFKNGMMFTRATELYLEEHGMTELIPEETLLKSYFQWVKKVERK
ncbi:hypothetical protein [uncultured Bacteroides sp.]|uniref:hypothetical protein n=1 Tax=uncultured Bacteroides sp. TaxID=162156 RepID=UPI00259920C0|nr:hypothetical protein [uncultured Bacteroides sp.]